MYIKAAIFILFISLSSTSNLSAQQTSSATMQISATVVDGMILGVNNVNIHFDVKEISESYRISPSDGAAATYSIYSSPGRIVSITFKDSVLLFNPSGDTLKLDDFSLLIGDSNNPDEMEPILPIDCTNLIVPDNGKLYLRIGGSFSGTITTKGLYTGNINIDSRCLDS